MGSHNEINWKVKIEEITLRNTGINSNIRRVPQFEINVYVFKLEIQEIVEDMKFGERVCFSPTMFLQKARKTE